MGASSSTEHNASQSQEQNELESLATSTGSLTMLQNAFSKLSNPHTKSIPLKSLQGCFSLTLKTLEPETSPIPKPFLELLPNLGPAIIDLLFNQVEGVNWLEFLKDYIRVCGRMPLSGSLNLLLKLYATIRAKSGVPSKLEFESDSDDGKISGSLMAKDLLMILWLCWIMSQNSKILKLGKENVGLVLPDIDHLVFSALEFCEVGDGLNIRECDIFGLENQISAQKVHMWALTTVPGLGNCFTQYVNDRLQNCATLEDPNLDSPILSLSGTSSLEIHGKCLLTCGRAWALSLTMRNGSTEELLKVCFAGQGIGTSENLLYRSSLHGKGLSRFWSNVEGYHGSLLILIAASSIDANESDSNAQSWVIGILTQQGLESRDAFYGSSGYLYAISPIFHVFPPSGKDKNFVYSHLHPSGRVYEPHPKPVGIAFGGTVGNERIFIDEDFARATIRHHAADKTYKPGSLVPNQGYLAIEASVLEVEVWGLGGKSAKEVQDSYKKREQLFSEQRRTVDLKTFGSWEAAPEKIMMDMMGDPNRVQREDR
ncbi:TLD-domain containing nucleolar protein [Tasmannia lanceolata]|uniref:TLD-domain containing nucleolar protein n=1 Tax=Tasmannia lanceolata TaxID=3420 RepID=UPI0040632C83